MTSKLIPFTQEHLQPAVELFTRGYRREQFHSSSLPSRVLDDPSWIYAALQSKLSNPGVVIVEGDRLLAYMVTSGQFLWKGQQAAIVHEYCHSSIETRKQEWYQRMYMHLACEWLNQHVHLHLIGHFAHDALLQETLYQLGFGALVAERLRDCSAMDVEEDLTIGEEPVVSKLLDLHLEHIQYYPQSPIFLSRSSDRQSAMADLESHVQSGDVFFAFYEHNEPCAYLIVGKSTLGGEGFLLQETNTVQIKSSYVRPGLQGKGIGTALLQHAIRWSRDQGYERIFVEHETANLAGGNFWRKHFTPYLYFSMRYIDNTL